MLGAAEAALVLCRNFMGKTFENIRKWTAALLLFVLFAANGSQSPFEAVGESPFECESPQGAASPDDASFVSDEDHPSAKSWTSRVSVSGATPAFLDVVGLGPHHCSLFWSTLYDTKATSYVATSLSALHRANRPPLYIVYCAFVGDVDRG